MSITNFATTKWDLHVDICPCDVHFNAWTDAQKIKDRTIFHLGTGTHHIVGRHQAASGNRVFAITASPEEHDAYADLLVESPRLGHSYHCYFGDIYRTNPHLLPEFDIVNLFHLCEFFFPERMQDGAIDDTRLLDIMTDRTRVGGNILFYTKSKDFHAAEPVISAWEKTRAVERASEFKLLRIYRKRA